MEHYLFFSVERIRCGVPLSDTISMIRMVSISPYSDPQKGQTGVINLHGETLPVYSLRELFGFQKRSPLPSDNLIIVQKGLETVALWVDETFIVQEGDLRADDRFRSERLQTMIPGIRIIRSDLVIFFDLIEFLDYGIHSQTKLVDVIQIQDNESDAASDSFLRDDLTTGCLLQERADQLALPKEQTERPPVIEVIRFNLMYQEYAVEMKYIREVIQTSEITPVPGTPDFIAGICSVRGEIISLVNLRVLLSIPEKGLTDLNRVIVLTDGNLTFGLLADQITGIGMIKIDEIDRKYRMENSIWKNYICGTIESLHVLNAKSLLTDPRMIIDDTET
ncbi:chemotaxis protein CheW [Methanospirillum sp. J.3.6.1-F.2.7.3]|jgi:purine-binding chemotaxis protein CheW|uniref:Chemotaxis protein CheW n=2 Tax=Methanospirillum TaxID=2202 RepID=A0A8E7AUP6_9EURY|nr:MULTISPECIES: chemotaxis protein CheW [Methanospirillum]MDX8551358.1 chemotaxis protein CheW [Methanospirillum hungatei]NLW76417.1 chemotaxis protein CheW [Methanomicrobiales archaeon]QVV87877.1 chemotaxis protein CheW [Methanospirillum sp. J.3.6.1-F.2.7.3]QXO95181.1 chemotaxis protein CheW [Methanospirillum hungatei]